jgi:hypothetical protein
LQLRAATAKLISINEREGRKEIERVPSERCKRANGEVPRGMALDWLFCNDGGLPGNVESLATAHVLAGHHVVFSNHVGPGLREPGTVAVVGASCKLLFLGANNPCDFVVGGLTTVRTVEGSRFLLLFLVKKIALFHAVGDRPAPNTDYCIICIAP